MGILAPQIATHMCHPPLVYNTIQMSAIRQGIQSIPHARPWESDAETGEILAESAMAEPTQSLRELINNIALSVTVRTILRPLRIIEIKEYRT